MADIGTVAERTTVSATPVPRVSEKELLRWQRKLLPFMVAFMVALAVAFFAMSIYDVLQVKDAVFMEHGENIRAIMQSRVAARPGENRTVAESTQEALLLLESDALDKRYHQASALLMSRIWTKHLSFLTGMVLALLGATFILGKLSESTSNISGSGAGWKAEISSASPGIILAFFGTVLLSISLVVQPPIAVDDKPVYVSGIGVVNPVQIVAKPSAAEKDVKPLPKPNAGILDLEKPEAQAPASPQRGSQP
jgi:hypothetical protein